MTSPSLDAFLSAYSPAVRALALEARRLVLESIPGVTEMVDPPSGIVAYGFSPKYADLVCAVAPFTAHVNLMFARGAQLPDPDGLLAGTGKKARHLKIHAPEDLQRPGLRALLQAALELSGRQPSA